MISGLFRETITAANEHCVSLLQVCLHLCFCGFSFFLFALHVICMSFQVILFFSETIQTFLLGFSVQILAYLLLTEATYSGVKKLIYQKLFFVEHHFCYSLTNKNNSK